MKDTVDNPFKGVKNNKHSGQQFEKIKKIFLEAIPVLLMITLIPFIQDDYKLALAYCAIILIALLIKYEKKEIIILIAGLIVMFIFEFIFISTGVETFLRNSLFGKMPLWLPILWAYGFIAIKRTTRILEE